LRFAVLCADTASISEAARTPEIEEPNNKDIILTSNLLLSTDVHNNFRGKNIFFADSLKAFSIPFDRSRW
jgi:hypothetical protein